MPVEIVWGTGEGSTQLSAFDASLAAAGIHNYNLVTLSSIIPDGRSVSVKGSHDGRWDVGELVGVVLAENESAISGETISAGLGWVTAEEGGVFYEATAESAANVESQLHRGLERAKSIRDGWGWDDTIETQIVDHTVEDNGAVIASAVYRPV